MQVRVVHHIEIHQPDSSDSRRRQIHPQRSAQAARAHQQHARVLQLELPVHADFRHNQMPAVTQNLFVRQRCRVRRNRHRHRRFFHRTSARDARHNGHRIFAAHRRRALFQIADVLVIHVNVDVAAQRSGVAIKLLMQIGVARRSGSAALRRRSRPQPPLRSASPCIGASGVGIRILGMSFLPFLPGSARRSVESCWRGETRRLSRTARRTNTTGRNSSSRSRKNTRRNPDANGRCRSDPSRASRASRSA